MKEITVEQLNNIFYALTYENGRTFGMCGNADELDIQALARLINQHFANHAVRNGPPEYRGKNQRTEGE